jgi:hypothetical protein
MLESVFPRLCSWPCFAAAYSIYIEHFLIFEHIQSIEHSLTFEHIQNIEHSFISADLEAFGFSQFSVQRGSSFPPARTAFGRPRYPAFCWISYQ